MTQKPYYVIPPERDWYSDQETCAQALVDGADGRRGELAALSLLFRDPDLTIFRADVIDEYMWGISPATVNWQGLHMGIGSGMLSLAPEARAVVMLACSLASSACLVRLGDLLGDLGDETRAAFIDAAAYLFRGDS